MKIGKRITFFPQKFKSVTLSVEDADSIEEANKMLCEGIAPYVQYLEQDYIELCKKTIGLVVINE
jgi:hypothetical protein